MRLADKPRVTLEECDAKAAECRAMAKQTLQSDHRVMLEHIADIWERIGSGMKTLH